MWIRQTMDCWKEGKTAIADWKFIKAKYQRKALGRIFGYEKALGFKWAYPHNGTLSHEEFNDQIILKGRPDLMIDAGACIGRWSIPASRHFKNVIAFEPFPESAHYLRRNLVLNHIYNVKIEEVALSDQDGEANLNLYRGSVEEHSLLTEHITYTSDTSKPVSNMPVKTRTLDSYGYEPDLIKLDVEGAELKVLEGGTKTITESRPTLLVEVHVRGYEDKIKGMLPSYEWETRYRQIGGGRTQSHMLGLP